MFTRHKIMITTTLAATVMVGAVLTNAVHAGGRRKAKPRAAQAAATATPKKVFTLPDKPFQPTWQGWRVEVLPDVKGAKRESHLAFAKALSGMDAVPADRPGHFQALNTPDFRLDGWHAFIESSTATPDGALVTLRVSPIMSSTHGASTTILDYVFERYEVTDAGVRYLNSWEPPGGSHTGYIGD